MAANQLSVTMATVAKEARVSRATVSRVLSGDTRVDPASVRRVRAAVAKLGYVRNAAASQLARRQSTLVGVLVRSVVNPAYAYLQEALIAQARDRGIFLVTVSTGSDDRAAAEGSHIRRCLELRPAGIIVSSGLIRVSDISDIAAQVPTVVTPRPEKHPDLYTVAYDEIYNSELIARTVAERGHRCVAIVTNAESVSHTEALRGQVMAATLREAGVEVIDFDDLDAINDIDIFTPRIYEAMDRGCTCVMFPNDQRALRFLMRAGADGVDVPGQLSVTGLDGVGDAVALAGLTTVRNPIDEVARAAIEAIAVLIGHAEGEVETKQFFTGTLIGGRTLADLRVDNIRGEEE